MALLCSRSHDCRWEGDWGPSKEEIPISDPTSSNIVDESNVQITIYYCSSTYLHFLSFSRSQNLVVIVWNFVMYTFCPLVILFKAGCFLNGSCWRSLFLAIFSGPACFHVGLKIQKVSCCIVYQTTYLQLSSIYYTALPLSLFQRISFWLTIYCTSTVTVASNNIKATTKLMSVLNS